MSQDREDALRAAETAMALRMKEGLADYKKGFAKRVAAFAVVFVVGVAIGAALFGTKDNQALPFDWQSSAATYWSVARTERLKVFVANDSDLSKHLDEIERKTGIEPSDFSRLILQGKEVTRLKLKNYEGNAFTLFIANTAKADLSEPVVGLRRGVQSATWTKNGYDYLILSDAAPIAIWNAAKALAGP